MEKQRKLSANDWAIGFLLLADILLLFLVLALENTYIDLAFASLILISGVLLLKYVTHSILESVQSKKWVQAPYEVFDGKIDWKKPSSAGHNSTFIPQFKIRYRYDDIVYTRTSNENLNLSIRRVFSTMEKAQRYLDSVMHYQYGNVVYINPTNPHIAYLCTGIGRDQYGMLLFSLILITLPLLTFLGIIEWCR